MAKKINPEIPDPQAPEITPETVPNKPATPFEEPEIIPEDEPGGTSPAEIPVPDTESPAQPETQPVK